MDAAVVKDKIDTGKFLARFLGLQVQLDNPHVPWREAEISLVSLSARLMPHFEMQRHCEITHRFGISAPGIMLGGNSIDVTYNRGLNIDCDRWSKAARPNGTLLEQGSTSFNVNVFS